MARATDAQKRQRELAWLLYQLGGARGNLYPRHQSKLPDAIFKRLKSLCLELDEITNLTRACMMHDANLRRQSFDAPPPSSRRTLHDDYDPYDFT